MSSGIDEEASTVYLDGVVSHLEGNSGSQQHSTSERLSRRLGCMGERPETQAFGVDPVARSGRERARLGDDASDMTRRAPRAAEPSGHE